MSQAPDPKINPTPSSAIDKADLEAVRRFLPGKLIGRTAAFLSLLVLVLTQAGLIETGLKKLFAIDLPHWMMALLVGFAFLAVASQSLAEWVADNNRRKTQALAVTHLAVPAGYFRIGPYLAEDAQLYQRADQAHEKVLAWLTRASAVPLYLTGDSGSGKSSLLNAFVFPRLRERRWTLIEVRAWQDPVPALHLALTKWLATQRRSVEQSTPLRTLIETVARCSKDHVLLIVDQFEEFLILAPPETKAAFAALIAQLQAEPIPGLGLLLVLRSDYQTALDDAGLPVLRQQENWFQVGRFTLAASQGFMERSALGLQADALARILTSAAEIDDSPGLIRPITLNVIGYVLAEGMAEAPSLDACKLIQHYVGQAVEQPAIRDYARPVLQQLLTEQGSKRPRSEQELAESTQLRRAEVRAVLNGLAMAALARPLDATQGVWELAHDFVARAFTAYLGQRQDKPWWQTGTYYAAPTLLTLMLTVLATFIAYQVVVVEPEREKHRPIYREADWVRIEPGSFCMGARTAGEAAGDCRNDAVDPEAQRDEKPAHRVKISKPFLLSKYEVTLEEYERFTYDKGRNPPGDAGFGAELNLAQQKRLPVIDVSWQEAKDYAAWLSEKTGKSFRLPSEAEWEYAARAGTSTPRFWDRLSENVCHYANVLDRQHRPSTVAAQEGSGKGGEACDDPYANTAPVGSFAPNAWGLHDMIGNVWEWVEDNWHDSYHGAPTDGSAWNEGGDAGRRVIRGGSWIAPGYLRSTNRQWSFSSGRLTDLGFRLAQDI